MIRDKIVRNEIAKEWRSIKILCRDSHRGGVVGGGFGAVYVNETPPESFYNLPLVLAYAILDEVFNALIAQGAFACTSWMIGPKMKASKTKLPWQNYSLVWKGKIARDKLAHKAILVEKVRCLEFIEAIEVELKAWGVI